MGALSWWGLKVGGVWGRLSEGWVWVKPEEICVAVCADGPHVDTDTQRWAKRSDGFLSALMDLWKSFSLQGAVVVEPLWKLWAHAATAILCTKLSSNP